MVDLNYLVQLADCFERIGAYEEMKGTISSTFLEFLVVVIAGVVCCCCC
jgi:hypothetical protein